MMFILSLILIAALIGEDQLIKLWVVCNYEECRGGIRNYFSFKIGEFRVFSLTHIRNNGAGWSILGGQTVFLSLFTAIVIVGIFVYMIIKCKKLKSAEWISFSLIIAGGFGNLIDRIRMLIEGTDKFSGVIDYFKLDFIDFPVFNFADCCVVVGAILFCLIVIIDEINADKTKNAEKVSKTEQPTQSEQTNEQI